MRFLVVGETPDARERGRRAVLALGLECSATDAIGPERLTDRVAVYPPVEAVLVLGGRDSKSAVEWVARNLGLPVFLAGGRADDAPNPPPPMFHRLHGANIRDELARELNKGETMPRGSFRWGRVVAVFAAQSGTGATTIACGLAQWLRDTYRQEVVVAEVGSASPDLCAVLGLDPPNGIAELIDQSERLDSAMLQQAMIGHGGGIRVLGYRADQDGAVEIGPEAARGLAYLFRGLFDWTVLDLGHTITEGNRTLLQMVETIVFPINLDVPGLKRARHMLRRLDEENLAGKVLVAVSYYGQRGLLAWQDAVETIGRPIDVWLPDDPRPVNAARNEGQPVPMAVRGSALSKALKKLSKMVADRTPATRKAVEPPQTAPLRNRDVVL
jgi:MinD-like ATPase involved in chromosome partitioning or flagellar assembly